MTRWCSRRRAVTGSSATPSEQNRRRRGPGAALGAFGARLTPGYSPASLRDAKRSARQGGMRRGGEVRTRLPLPLRSNEAAARSWSLVVRPLRGRGTGGALWNPGLHPGLLLWLPSGERFAFADNAGGASRRWIARRFLDSKRLAVRSPRRGSLNSAGALFPPVEIASARALAYGPPRARSHTQRGETRRVARGAVCSLSRSGASR